MILSLTLSQIAALIIVTVALVIDWRTTKIPNLLTFPAALLGITLNAISGGLNGALYAVSGWLVGVLIMLIASYAPIGPKDSKEKLGMGDVKLMGSMGALLGPSAALVIFLYFCIAYGVISILGIARVIPWKQVGYLLMLIFSRQTAPPVIDQKMLLEARKKPIPVGLAIGIGTFMVVFFEKATLKFLGFV